MLTPASLGRSAMLTVDAPNGTPKAERPERREQGRVQGEALWQCALSTLDAARAAQEEEREEQREERQERPAERAEQNAANLDVLKGMMDAVQQSTQQDGAFDLEPVESSSSPASSSEGGGFAGSCCINGTFFSCPSLEAVHTCSGAFMSCQSGCGFDMDCIGSCSRSHPLDPSMCSQDDSRNGECQSSPRRGRAVGSAASSITTRR